MPLFVGFPKFLKLLHLRLLAHCVHEGGCDHAHAVILQHLVPLNKPSIITPNWLYISWWPLSWPLESFYPRPQLRWPLQDWSTPQSRLSTLGPRLSVVDGPTPILVHGSNCISPTWASPPPPRPCQQLLVVVLEPPMSSPHQLAKAVDKPRGVHVVVSCGFT